MSRLIRNKKVVGGTTNRANGILYEPADTSRTQTDVETELDKINSELTTSSADNIDGNNLLVGYKKGDIRELFFAALPVTVGGTAGVGSLYTPKRTLLFPISSIGIGTISCRITTSGDIELLGAGCESITGTHRLYGHVMYLH